MDYRLHDGNLTIPDDWQDETMHIFRAPDTEGYNLVINRSPIPHGIDPLEHLKSQYTIIRETLKDYNEVSKKPVTVDGIEYRLVSYDWDSPEGKVHQINLMIIAEQTLLSMTATAAALMTDSQQKLVENTMTSFIKKQQ